MDQNLFHLINEQWTSPALDLFMAALSNVEIWKPFLIGIAIYLIAFGGFKGRAFICCLLVSLAITEQVTGSLKNAVGRHRPKQVQRVRMVQLQKARPEFMTLFKKRAIRYSDETDWNKSGPSFPSGHVTNNTVIGFCCLLFFRKRGWLYFFITAAIGYSRIYLGAHWPSDVFATFFLAAGEALILLALFELLWRKLAPRFAPNVFARHPRLIENRVS
ncbi:MAG: hypothetical protein QOI04_109 [Verrucomicrobiota bacterium]